MFSKNFKVYGNVAHKPSLQAIVIEMVHMRHMRCGAFLVVSEIKEGYQSRVCLSSCAAWCRKNEGIILQKWTWVILQGNVTIKLGQENKGSGHTGAVFLNIFESSNKVFKFIFSVAGKNSASSDLWIIACRSAPFVSKASLRAILTSDRVPSFLFFRTLSADMLCLYLSAKVSRVSINSRGHSVAARMANSSLASIGWLGIGKNILACSSNSQSFRRSDLDAVLMTRKEGWVIESSPD